MKKTAYRTILASLLMAVILFACEKEKPAVLATPEEEEEAALITVADLVAFAEARYFSGSIDTDEEDGSFVIANEGLIDEYTADERGFGQSRPQHNGLIACLVSVEPDLEQRPLISAALREYRIRNQRIINAYRQQFQNIRQRMEGARRQMYEQFRSGRFDREQYRRQMQMLRERYMEALQDMREAHAEAFSASYELLLEKLQEILSEEQWEAFAECLMSE